MAKVPETHLLLPDFHFPEYHRGLWRAVLAFLDKNKVAGITWMGDQLDLAEIAHHNEGKPGLKVRGALKANLDGFAERLDEIDARVGKDCLKRWHTGNHERFIQDFYEKSPELEGMLDVEHHLQLEKRGYEIFALGEMSELGQLGVIHGDQVGSGQFVAKKLVDSYCQNMVMGHVHTKSSFTKVSAARAYRKWIGQTLGTMGTINPRFARNRPSGHVHGLGVVELMHDGWINLFPIVADSGTGGFAYGGQYYAGKK